MAPRRTLAAGSSCAAKFCLGFSLEPGRSDDPATALEMGAAWRDLSGQPRATERQSSGVAAIADGPRRAGISSLCEFRGLHRMEQLADLFGHRRLSRYPHRRQPTDASP